MKSKLSYLKLIVMSIFILLMGIPFQTAQADMGPKPTVEFDFVYETSQPLDIVTAALIECETSECLQPQPLEEMGPQYFACEDGRCTSMAYGYADYLYLEITFSDGITRQSNVFNKEHFDALYQVTVRSDDMWVEETGGQSSAVGGVLGFTLIIFCLVGLALLGGLIFVIVLIVRASRKK